MTTTNNIIILIKYYYIAQHKTFVEHLYKVGPTSAPSTLVQNCTNVIQMFCVCWGITTKLWKRHAIKKSTENMVILYVQDTILYVQDTILYVQDRNSAILYVQDTTLYVQDRISATLYVQDSNSATIFSVDFFYCMSFPELRKLQITKIMKKCYFMYLALNENDVKNRPQC